MTSYPHLPDAELAVMQALWALERYPAHTGDIAEKLSRDWKAPTLIKLLSRLEERGFVESEKEGRSNVYTPRVEREDYLAAESRDLLDKLYGGSLRSFAVSLCDGGVSREEIDELRRMLEEEELG